MVKRAARDDVRQAAEFITRQGARPAKIAVILGSGLSGVAAMLQHPLAIPYAKIKNFPPSRMAGHAGVWFAGETAERAPVHVLAGRVHLYEGYSAWEATFSVRVLAALGVRHLFLSNAAGSLLPELQAGALLRLTDHLNLMGDSPLAGMKLKPGESPFLDLSTPYDPDDGAALDQAAQKLGLPLARGVYAALKGPAYETPAEVRMLRALGATAAGMSTVPEAIMARYLGLKVTALSVITNQGAGIAQGAISHAAVQKQAQELEQTLRRLLREWLRRVALAPPK